MSQVQNINGWHCILVLVIFWAVPICAVKFGGDYYLRQMDKMVELQRLQEFKENQMERVRHNKEMFEEGRIYEMNYDWIQKWRDVAQVQVDQTRDELSYSKANPWEVHGYYSSREQIRLLNVIEDMRKALGFYAYDVEWLELSAKHGQELRQVSREVLDKYADRPGEEIQ